MLLRRRELRRQQRNAIPSRATGWRLPRCVVVGVLLLLPCIALHVTARCRIASHRIVSHRIALHRIALYRIASHCIASHCIASHRIASHRIVCMWVNLALAVWRGHAPLAAVVPTAPTAPTFYTALLCTAAYRCLRVSSFLRPNRLIIFLLFGKICRSPRS
jgi:hypothetical protein